MTTHKGSRDLSKGIKRTALSIALGVCVAGGVQAQSTTGNIFGKAEAGQTITITNADSGQTRSVTADAAGNYRALSLLPGNYKVTVGSDTRDVLVRVATGAQVDFSSDATNLDAVTVRGTNLPAIDVSQTDVRTVFTAEELSQYAVGHSINDVALLAPGVISSTSYSGIGSFGGSAASENAYYINGFPVTNPLTSIGYTSLGFDSIAQEQVLLGGYGAEYGRSTGGVVSIVTKRGTNEWKGGVYTIWTPDSLRGKSENIYYPQTGYWNAQNHYPAENTRPQNWTDGKLYDLNRKNENDTLTYGVWAGGPIIKDRLFIYANAERRETDRESSRYSGNIQGRNPNTGATVITAAQAAQAWGVYKDTYPRWTAKIDWNITDNHILEFTGVQDNTKTEWAYYGFDYFGLERNNVKYQDADHVTEDNARLYVGKYTGYLTDNLSISATYGQQKVDHIPDPLEGYDPTKTYISGLGAGSVPAAFGGISNPQPYQTITDPSTDETKGYRFDITYTWGKHELRAGVDHFEADSYIGDRYTGPGYIWVYGRQTTATENINASAGVGSPASGGGFGTDGYYVYKGYSAHGGTVSTEQEAWYLEDRWQVTDNFMLSLGLRNDSFTNYNGDHKPYVEQDNNWAPRVGFAWDVRGDSTLKLFGNVGRYHLALPNNVAIRGANASLSTQQYYTYTGIAADGTPTGLNPIPMLNDSRLCPNGGISTNLECGEAPDPATVAIVGLKAHYQDEYIFGMEKQESDTFSWGAKATYRDLKSAIDDTCPDECRIFNPGEAATFLIPNGDGTYETISYSAEDLGFPKLKRRYAALDLFGEYNDGTLRAKLEYTLSHNWGNAEGQLNSSVDTGSGGQSDVSVTQDWDLPELMEGAGGKLPNNRTHQLKAFGSLKLNEEWRVGGSMIVQSGRPRSCTSYYPYAKAGLYNGAYYYYCGLPGAASGTTNPADAAPESASYYFAPRGSYGDTPWTATFNFNVTYKPNWLDGLTVAVDVLNAFDRQTPTAYYDRYASSRSAVNSSYGRVLYYSAPRSVRFTVRYDF